MDLGTIKKKIADRKYKTLHQAAQDVRLVWTNCMTYNADGSDFFVLAQNLSKKWEDRYAKLLSDLGMEDTSGAAATAATGSSTGVGSSGGPSTTTTTPANVSSSDPNSVSVPPSVASTAMGGGGSGLDASKISIEDKRQSARSLYKISKEDLGKLIVEVDNKCPAALTKNAAEDECELNVDKLTPSLFQELKQFVASCGGASGNNKSQPATKKKSASTGSAKRQKI